MGRSTLLGTSVAAAFLAACGASSGSGGANAAKVALDSGFNVEVGTMRGQVMGSPVTNPPCPVMPHFEAVLSVTRYNGAIRYRWERSTGDSSRIYEVDAPAGAKAGSDTVRLKDDEWRISDRGVQTYARDSIHVLSPVDRRFQPMLLNAVCY